MAEEKGRRLDLVILDWAGTTVDYGCFAPAVAFVEACEQVGFKLNIEEARVPMGLKKDEHIQEFLGLGRRYQDHPLVQRVVKGWTEQFGMAPTQKDSIEIFQRFIPAQIAALPKYAELIPGTLEAVAELRKQGLKIGSTSGYMGHDTSPDQDMMQILLKEAEKRGYVPDVSVCATGHVAERDWNKETWKYSKVDLPQARPAPWMCSENARRLNVYPSYCCLKVDDTVDGVLEGVNAGMWTIGLVKTGSDMGLSQADVEALPQEELWGRLQANAERMRKAGADYIVEGIWEVPKIVEQINYSLKTGVRPQLNKR